MLKRLLYTVRNAIFWMTLSAVLEGISGLFLFVVILDWHLDTTMPLTLFALSSLTTLAVTFIATKKAILLGVSDALSCYSTYSPSASFITTHIKQQPTNFRAGMSVPAHLLHSIISGLITPCTIVIGVLIYQSTFGAILLFILFLLLISLRLSASKIAFSNEQLMSQNNKQ
ncbi:hypothetical protein J4731_14670 [Providencia rettgeri]|nr:hypothetical protein [Providencia rettgeri]